MRKSLEHVLAFVVRVCCVLVFVVPLIVTPNTYFPFIFGKMIVFELFVEIAVACWIVLCVVHPVYRPTKSRITIAFGLFIAALALSAIFGVDPFRSFWSYQERMTGVIAYAHFYLWYLMLVSCFREWKQWQLLLWTAMGTSTAMALVALGQQTGIAFFGIPIGQGRAIATLGNAIYIGVFGLICVFLGFVLLLRAPTKLRRWSAAVMLIPNLYLIAASGSRMVMLTSLLVLAIGAGYMVFKLPNRRVRQAGIMAFCALFAILAASYMWLHTPNGNMWGVKNLPEVLQRSLGSDLVDNSRLELWRVGLMGFRERPLFGWGWENFNAVYYAYAVPDRNGAHIQEAFFDRSHNQVIDVLALSGLIGIAAYLFVWFALFSAARIVWQSGVHRVSGAFIFLALASYFLAHLTVFDTPSSLILFFGLAALLAFLESESRQQQILTHESVSVSSIALVGFGSAALAIASIGIVVVLPWNASTKVITALKFMGSGNVGASLENYDASLKRTTAATAEIRRSLGQSALELVSRSTPAESDRVVRWLTYALAEAEKNLDHEPREIRNHLLIVELSQMLAQADASYLRRAGRVSDAAYAMAPTRIEVLMQQARIAALKGEFALARQWVQRAKVLDPNGAGLASFIERFSKAYPSSSITAYER